MYFYIAPFCKLKVALYCFTISKQIHMTAKKKKKKKNLQINMKAMAWIRPYNQRSEKQERKRYVLRWVLKSCNEEISRMYLGIELQSVETEIQNARPPNDVTCGVELTVNQYLKIEVCELGSKYEWDQKYMGGGGGPCSALKVMRRILYWIWKRTGSQLSLCRMGVMWDDFFENDRTRCNEGMNQCFSITYI